MEKEIVKLTKDVEYVKGTTEEIKLGVASLVAKAEENHDEILELRGRTRELEHDVMSLKTSVKDLSGLIWKLFTALGVGGGGAIGIWEIFSK
jgi:uncharacterized coiled-coil DUF342 family protein